MSSKRRRMRRIIELLDEHYERGVRSYYSKRDPFRTLIGCVLSHRTRDENAGRAARNLFEAASTPKEVLMLRPEELKRMIRCSGFYNQKAEKIRSICQALEEDYGGTVPEDRAVLMSLPGVGPKTADIVLSHAFDRPAIAVDVHVARVTKRLGIADENASPEEVKEVLEGLVPLESYRFVDSSFVRLGKECCRSRNPRCQRCILNRICEHGSQRVIYT